MLNSNENSLVRKLWVACASNPPAIGSVFIFPDRNCVFKSRLDAEMHGAKMFTSKQWKNCFIVEVDFDIMDYFTLMGYQQGIGGTVISSQPISESIIVEINKRVKMKKLEDMRTELIRLESEIKSM